MLFKYLNVDPATELKMRMKKANKERMTKKILRLVASNRKERYINSRTDKEIIAGVLDDCVVAVSNLTANTEFKSPCPEIKSPLPEVKSSGSVDKKGKIKVPQSARKRKQV